MAAKASAQITLFYVVDVKATYRYYRLQSSTASTPSKPTVFPPNSWDDTEPSYVEGSTNSLFFVDCTIFNDNSFVYSEVSLSSSYEASKIAYNKAAAVETRVTEAETVIEQNKEAITLRATKTEVTNYIASRGENLVTNGTAFLGDNTNFSGFIYDGAESYYSGGSFKTVSKYVAKSTDEYMPVDVSQKYTLSYWIKPTESDARYYDAIFMFDVDKKMIMANHVMWVDGSTTTLSQDLNPGDTVVHLQSVAGFNKTATNGGQRGVIIWNYKNSKGYQYGVETYSRYVYTSLWDDATAFNAENNTITLKQAWPYEKITAGTSLSQSNNGSTYVYLNANYKVTADTWTQKKGTISGVSKNFDGETMFREGTAFIRICWLLNYGGTDSVTTHISTVSFTKNVNHADVNSEIQSVKNYTDAIATRIDTAESSINQLSNQIKMSIRDKNGETAMVYDSTTATWYYNIGTVNDKVNTMGQNVSDLSDSVNDIQSTISNVDESVKDLLSKVAYIRNGIDEDGSPYIELGKEDSDFKLRITNTAINLMSNNTSPVRIINNENNIGILNADNISVDDELEIGTTDGINTDGKFVWKKRSNGNLGLQWKG